VKTVGDSKKSSGKKEKLKQRRFGKEEESG
jgi:hypothetical protein